MKLRIKLLFLMMLLVAMGITDNNMPADIEQLFTNFVIDWIKIRPETGTELGLPPELNIPLRNDLLNDVSDQGADEELAFFKKYHDQLLKFGDNTLNKSQQINKRVLLWYIKNAINGDKYRNYRAVVNPLFGFHNQLTTLMTEHHQIRNLKDAKDYIERLKQFDDQIDELITQLESREEKGIMEASFLITSYQNVISEYLNVPLEENILYTSFLAKLKQLKKVKADEIKVLDQEAQHIIKNSVYPAYQRMLDQLSAMLPRADDRAGVWKLPKGDEYYQYCLRFHTTTSMTPEQIHQLGLQEVKRIQNEMIEYFKIIGLEGESFAEYMKAYLELTSNRDDERFYYPATELGQKKTLAGYKAIIDTMAQRLDEFFEVKPRTTVDVLAVPDFKAATAGTYYQPPKLDGSAGGIFYTNLSYQHQKAGMRALAYHEAIPGHHFQIALEQELSGRNLFKALLFFTGYIEGWALYAERLAKEYGFYKDNYSMIGYLRSELFRAARLVLDTGIHYKKWNRDEAYQYMLENIGWAWFGELDRYVLWPGQACSYKIGELKIIELRERAKKELGDQFDIKKFHTVILSYGQVPLEIVEELVDDYIKANKIN